MKNLPDSPLLKNHSRRMKPVSSLLLFLFLLLFLLSLTAFSSKRAAEKNVFTTAAFRTKPKLKLNGTSYTLTTSKKCIETGNPPYDCRTTIKFSPADFPDLIIHGDAYAFAAADINQDGKTEFLALASEHGNWRTVSVNALSSAAKTSPAHWYRPVSEFLWYPALGKEKGCDAKIFWLSETKQVKVITTNAADEAFACTKTELLKWRYW